MLAIKSINGTQLAVQPLSDGYSVICSDLLAEGSGALRKQEKRCVTLFAQTHIN